MEYRKLGDCGLRVSALSIGGWLTIGGSLDSDAAIDILDAAVEGGMNYIDLADAYAKGMCETVFADFLRRYVSRPGKQRSDLVISTKVFWPMGDGPNDRGLSRKHLMESVDKSLARMGLDYVDLYFCHRPDPDTPIRETARAMDDLCRAGKVLHWGTSCWHPAHFDEAWALHERWGWDGPVVEQPRYNLIDRGIERDVIPSAMEHGMGLVIWSPLAQGLLTGKYSDGVPPGSRADTTKFLDRELTPENIARADRLCELAADHGTTSAAIALRWAMDQPGVSSVITGASRVAHVEGNLAALELNLSDEVKQELERLFPSPVGEPIA